MKFKELPIGARFTINFLKDDNEIFTKINDNHYHYPNASQGKKRISVYPTTYVKEIK